ncbi:MAG: hypothetical protein ABI363_05710 [Nitrosospira sp.]
MTKIYFRAGLLTLTGIFLAGCVTINIYFPAAAAEKAADKIIEEVWQLKKPEEGVQDADKPAPSQPSMQPAQPAQPLQP